MTKKKIELSKETLRELTMRPLTEAEQKLAAGGIEINTYPCMPSTEINTCSPRKCQLF
jgi:hypothetical protein